MADIVRVRLNGVEKNMGRAMAESSEGVEILVDEPTHRADGRVRDTTSLGGRPLKPRTTVDAAASKKTAKPRTRKPRARKPKATTEPPAADAAGQKAVTSADNPKEQS